MDPTQSIAEWWTSVAGVVAATIAVTQYLKWQFAEAKVLSAIPTWVYVMLVSCGLTEFARDVLHTLDGERAMLLTQAVTYGLMASGGYEIARAIGKPLGNSTTAINRKVGALLLPLLLAGTVGVSACASARGPLLSADRSIHASLAAVQDTANTLCDAQVIAADPCRDFNRELVPALEAGDAFNRAVRADRVGSLADLLQAVSRLTAAINTYIPEAQRQRLLDLLGQAVSLGFQGAQ